MAAVLPTEYLSMNHSKAWKLTLSTIVAAVVVEYSIILLLYQTTCTKFNTHFILTFHKFHFDNDAIEFREKPATMWAHATSGAIPLSIKFAVFLWKKKRFQGRRIRNNVVVPLYQCKQSDRKAFLNISEYIQKNFNPVQVSNERDIDLVDTDRGDLNSKSINKLVYKKKFDEKVFGNKSDLDIETIELGVMPQKENIDKTLTKPNFSYTFIDEKKKITCDKPDITKGENDSCISTLGLDQPELDLAGSMASCSLEPRREIEHLRIPSTNSNGSSGNLNPDKRFIIFEEYCNNNSEYIKFIQNLDRLFKSIYH